MAGAWMSTSVKAPVAQQRARHRRLPRSAPESQAKTILLHIVADMTPVGPLSLWTARPDARQLFPLPRIPAVDELSPKDFLLPARSALEAVEQPVLPCCLLQFLGGLVGLA